MGTVICLFARNITRKEMHTDTSARLLEKPDLSLKRSERTVTKLFP
jgi:hypothetical protein